MIIKSFYENFSDILIMCFFTYFKEEVLKSIDKKYVEDNKNSILKFILLSLIGIILFVIPIVNDGNITIPVAILSNIFLSIIEHILPDLLFLAIIVSTITTIIYKIIKISNKDFTIKYKFIDTSLDISNFWFIMRILSGIFVIFIRFNFGFEVVYSGATGGMIFNDLLPTLFAIFLFAGLFLPLLLNFGLLDLIGTLLVKIMRPVFKLPGRSAIDCIASWLGDGTVGILLTNKQYEEGFYTEREASVIGTNFSLVSITFSLIIINEVDLSHMFVPYYFTVTFASLIAAIIVPKFGPLAKKKDLLINGEKSNIKEDIPDGKTMLEHGIIKAVSKASTQTIKKNVFLDGFKNVFDLWFSVIPTVLSVGTIALIIAEYTPFFKIIGLPLYPILLILGVPEAMEASTTLMAGFADMLLPAILANNIESDMTRFVIACTSVSQLIYLSEVGALLISSKIPINLKDLFIIFIQRTLITLPIIAAIAHIIKF